MKVILLLIIATFGIWFIYRNTHPKSIGIDRGRLQPCPWTPNCVSSLANDKNQKVAPFEVPKNKNPIPLLSSIITSMPGSRIIHQSDTYLHAEFHSKVFHFIDDVEFHFLPDQNLVHVRSAARVGYSDFGVNRARIDKIREKYYNLISPHFSQNLGESESLGQCSRAIVSKSDVISRPPSLDIL